MIEDQHADETQTQESKEARLRELTLKIQTWKMGDYDDPDQLVAEYFQLRKELKGN